MTQYGATGRNDPCTCGSGKKYKKCCGKPSSIDPSLSPGGQMGIFHEYVAKKLDPKQADAERKAHLRRIGELLECDVITYAARLSPTPVPVPSAVTVDDLVPFVDLLAGLKSRSIAVVLETHGGAGEIGRQIVEILHERFDYVRFIVPGTAKSTGTIMVLGGHEILMSPGSSLGPIDAQLQQDGKTYSADALIEGLNRIKLEVEANNGKLNPAYIPFLQKLSPGELEHAHNALEFARETVREWLIRYKFEKWDQRRSSGEPVTPEYKAKVADDIARQLSSQARWKTHGRSLRIPDLRGLGLQITDFSESPDLFDAIQRYYILLQMALDGSNIYKIYETSDAIVTKRFQLPPSVPGAGIDPLTPKNIDSVQLQVTCNSCNRITTYQLDFVPGQDLQAGSVRYPDAGNVPCPGCGNRIDLSTPRSEIERRFGKAALNPQPK